MANIIELKNIVKDFSGVRASDNITLSIPEGSIYGLLGPNGAGKTTLIRIITNILEADSGEIYIKGERVHRRNALFIGYMPEERGLYKKMKVGEQLLYLSQLKGQSASVAKAQIMHWLERWNISDWWNKKVSELSKGMQQKIQFISTVAHKPELIILDEPFSGLDPINTNLIKDEIYNLRAEGASIIFSTHRMEQVEEICEKIALVHKGKVVLSGEVDELKQQFKNNTFQIAYSGEWIPSAEQGYTVIEQNSKGAIVQLSDSYSANDFLAQLIKQEVQITSFSEILPSLNEIFIDQVGGDSDE